MHNIRHLTTRYTTRELLKRLKQSNQQKLRWMSNVEMPPQEKPIISEVIPKGILGQPTCHTHPHLVAPGHLTCGISQHEYKERRDTFVNRLSAEVEHIHKTHIIVIPAACKQYMSDKIPYVFRQNSDFFYLTGCLEPSAVLVLVKPAHLDKYQSILFVHDKDSHAELWEGPRTGCTSAATLFGVDEARPIESFDTYILRTTASSKPAILWYHNTSPSNPELSGTMHKCTSNSQVSLNDPQLVLHHMRVIKSPAEIELLKEVCSIGSHTVNLAMACTRPGVSEHAISALLEYSGRMSGADHAAFPPVVASGVRATHIHYISNNQLLAREDMLLVDSGCQRWLYNSDISRTWPVSGTFSKHHRILYELVLNVQKRLIELLDSQRPPLDQLFDHMCRLLGSQLQAEGILPRNIDNNDLIGRAYRLCPHHVSHYLGLDVHDAPLVRRRVPVRANMLVTVEPGIYIRPDDETVPPEFRGIGIRIEDDVLVTDGSVEVLTSSCVKEVADIEAIVGKQNL